MHWVGHYDRTVHNTILTAAFDFHVLQGLHLTSTAIEEKPELVALCSSMGQLASSQVALLYALQVLMLARSCCAGPVLPLKKAGVTC